jgi:hypothetical protein
MKMCLVRSIRFDDVLWGGDAGIVICKVQTLLQKVETSINIFALRD